MADADGTYHDIDRAQIAQTPQSLKLLHTLADAAYMACREDAPECDSYSWIVILINALHSDIIRRDDLTFICIPQGKMTGEVGTRAPDFKLVICSQRAPFPRAGKTYCSWEVKHCATLDALLTSKGSLGSHFAAEFGTAFPQLKEQADNAFEENPEMKVFRCVFSCGARFALIEWHRPKSSARPPSDPTCPWMPQFEQSLLATLDTRVSSTLKDISDYKDIKQWLVAHPVAEPGISDTMHDFRQDVKDHIDACEATRMGPELPRVYFFGQSIFLGEVAPPDSLNEEFRWNTIRDLSPQFLKAIDLIHRSPSLPPTTWASLPPESLFVPPTDPAVYTPQDAELRLARDALLTVNLRLLGAAYDSLFDLDVLDRSRVSHASLESEWKSHPSSDDPPDEDDDHPPHDVPAQQGQTGGPVRQPRKRNRRVWPSNNHRTRAWTAAHPDEA